MRFSKAAFAVDKQWVVSGAGIFGDLFCRSVSVVVGFADDEIFKAVVRVVDNQVIARLCRCRCRARRFFRRFFLDQADLHRNGEAQDREKRILQKRIEFFFDDPELEFAFNAENDGLPVKAVDKQRLDP